MEGNGAAMRVAPLGACFAEDYSVVVSQARASALSTHVHPEGVAGAIAVAIAAAAVVRGEPDLFLHPSWSTHPPVAPAMAWSAPTSSRPPLKQPTAQDTVPFCIWCASRFRHSYVECFWATLSGGGDRDTNCAITGGIVSLASPGLPPEWLALREDLLLGPLH